MRSAANSRSVDGCSSASSAVRASATRPRASSRTGRRCRSAGVRGPALLRLGGDALGAGGVAGAQPRIHDQREEPRIVVDPDERGLPRPGRILIASAQRVARAEEHRGRQEIRVGAQRVAEALCRPLEVGAGQRPGRRIRRRRRQRGQIGQPRQERRRRRVPVRKRCRERRLGRGVLAGAGARNRLTRGVRTGAGGQHVEGAPQQRRRQHVVAREARHEAGDVADERAEGRGGRGGTAGRARRTRGRRTRAGDRRSRCCRGSARPRSRDRRPGAGPGGPRPSPAHGARRPRSRTRSRRARSAPSRRRRLARCGTDPLRHPRPRPPIARRSCRPHRVRRESASRTGRARFGRSGRRRRCALPVPVAFRTISRSTRPTRPRLSVAATRSV